MNENSYNNLVDNHQQRLMEIEEKLTMIESKLKKQNEKKTAILGKLNKALCGN